MRIAPDRINLAKSVLFFSTNTTQMLRDQIQHLFDMQCTDNMGKYLGLPIMVGKDRRRTFRELKEKMLSRGKLWSNKTLSQGGKEVFIKSIPQAIPTYIMSCFLLPKVLCVEFDSIINNYWWKHSQRQHGVHRMKWQKMCRSKALGEMGFRNMAQFNIAMLCKQGWRLLKQKETLVYKVLQARYFPGKSFMESKMGNNSSFTWQSIWAARKTLEMGLSWTVGNGHNIRIWKDPWIKDLRNFKPSRPERDYDNDARVQELIDGDRHQWDIQKLRSLFSETEVAIIQEIPIGKSAAEDVLIWSKKENGCYNVRSGYKVLNRIQEKENLIQNEKETKFWKKLRAAKIPNIKICT